MNGYYAMTFLKENISSTQEQTGYAMAQLVRHCATSRKVAGSIPDGFTGIFH
jgi:hypothetical protein